MKRIVYAPKVNAFVRADSGIIDLSPYIVSGSVSRKLDAVSTARLEFRNPGQMFTKKAVFHPMDPITITLSRLPDHPVQVFTGYIDTAPYATLKPQTVGIEASCTLKKLLYTYFDSGLPFFHEFLHRRGWQMSDLGVQLSGDQGAGDTVDDQQAQGDNESPQLNEGLNDASFGLILYDLLLYVGNWHPNTIYIEKLPDDIVDIVEGIFYEIKEAGKDERKAFRDLLKEILEHNELGAGSPVNNGGGGGITSPVNGEIIGLNNPAHEEFCQIVAGGTGLSLRVLAAWCDQEGGPDYNPLNIGPGNTYGGIQAGARATINLLKEDLYQEIMDSAGKPDQAQIRAIASSPWLTGQPVFTQSYYDSILVLWQEISIRPRGNG